MIGTLNIKYEDGDTEINVSRDLIWRPPAGGEDAAFVEDGVARTTIGLFYTDGNPTCGEY